MQLTVKKFGVGSGTVGSTYLKLDGSNGPMTGDLDLGANDLIVGGLVDGVDVSTIPTTYLKLDCSNDPLTGDLEISKVNPILEVTDTTAGNSAYIKKVDTLNLSTYSNDVEYDALTTDTKLLLHCDGADGSTTITDSSPVPKSPTAVANAQLKTAQFKFGTASALMDGTGDYLNVPTSTDFDFSNGAFTIDFWARHPVTPTSLDTYCATGHTANGAGNGFSLLFNGANLQFYMSTGSVWTLVLSGAFAPTTNTWYHIAVTRSGNDFKLFIDGTSIATATNAITQETTSYDLRIGAARTSAANPAAARDMNVYIDEFRILKGTAAWTGNFTPPTSAYSGITQIEAIGLSIEDGAVAGDQGIVTLSNDDARTVINGKSQKFQIGGVEQFNLADGVIAPTTDNDIDMGSSSKRFKDIYNAAISSVGDHTIVKVNPLLTLTDTVDDYSGYIKKVNALHKKTISNEVDYNSVDSTVKLLMHCDGADGGTTFTDSSTFARALTAVGSVTTQVEQFKFGTASAYFTGAVQNQHVLIPQSTDFDLGTTNFDVSFWFRPDTIAAGTEILLCKRSAADYDLGFIEIQRVSGNILLYATSNGTSFDISNGKVFGAVTAGDWYYIRVSRVGNDWYMSIDGTQSAQNFTSSASVRVNTDAMAVGTIPGQTAYTTTGYIDEVYIAIGAGVSGDTGNFTPPTVPWGINQTETIGLTIEDGVLAAERGIVTLSNSTAGTIIDGINPKIKVAGVEQFNLADGVIAPTTDNDLDHGSLTKRIKDIWQSAKHYFRDAAIYISSENDGYLDLTADTAIRSNADHVLPKTSGKGIKVDTATPTFGFRDILSDISVKQGATDPVWTAFRGTLYQYAFSNAILNEIWSDFHIPHDYAPGTDIYIHIHWAQNVVDTGGVAGVPGVAKWYFDLSYAKGWGTAGGAADPFVAAKTISVTQQGSTTQYGHMIAEVIISGASDTATTFLRTIFEPDGIIKARLYRDPGDVADTLDQVPFGIFMDCHYQSTNLATKSKSRDFYT